MTRISQLPNAATLDGSETVVLVQGGITVKTTVAAIRPSQADMNAMIANYLASHPNAAASIVTNPIILSVTSQSPPGVQLALLSCPMIQGASFSLVSPSGRYTLSGLNGATLSTGNVPIDIANGTTDALTVKATGSDGVTSISQTLTVGVSAAASGSTQVDLNFVTAQYVRGTPADLVTTRATTTSITDSAGVTTVIPANAVAQNDLGVWVAGTGKTYISNNTLHPASFSLTGIPGGVSPAIIPDPNAGDTVSPNPALFTGNDKQGMATIPIVPGTPLVSGDVITVKCRIRNAVGKVDGGFLIGVSDDTNTGASSGYFLSNTTPTTPDWRENNTFTAGTAPRTTKMSVSNKSAAGFYEFVFNYTCAGTNPRVFWNFDNQAGAGMGVSIGGIQVVKGSADQPWADVGSNAAPLTSPGDQLSLGGLAGQALQSATGWIGLELQDVSYDTMGEPGLIGTVAGAVLSMGGATLLAPNGPTGFSAMGQNGGILGISGWRGIVRIALAWTPAGWFASCNSARGEMTLSGGSPPSPSATIGLLRGITGRLRRVTADSVSQSLSQLQAWTQLANKSFTRPGDALVPGAAHDTMFDPFNQNSIAQYPPGTTFPLGSQGIPGTYIYTGGPVDTFPSGSRFWVPRYFWETTVPQGSSHAINGEKQYYIDPQYANAWQGAHVFNAGNYEQHCVTKASLTSPQQAVIPADGNTGAAFAYVSAIVSTWGSFQQQYGLFMTRAQLPSFSFSWPAFWMYNPDGTEMDIEEYYGTAPQTVTDASHVPALNAHETFQTVMPFVVSAGFHHWASFWQQGSWSKYLDGKRLTTHATQTQFDASPKHLLLNLALQNANSQTDTDLNAGKGVAKYDFVHCMQFGA